MPAEVGLVPDVLSSQTERIVEMAIKEGAAPP